MRKRWSFESAMWAVKHGGIAFRKMWKADIHIQMRGCSEEIDKILPKNTSPEQLFLVVRPEKADARAICYNPTSEDIFANDWFWLSPISSYIEELEETQVETEESIREIKQTASRMPCISKSRDVREKLCQTMQELVKDLDEYISLVRHENKPSTEPMEAKQSMC